MTKPLHHEKLSSRELFSHLLNLTLEEVREKDNAVKQKVIKHALEGDDLT